MNGSTPTDVPSRLKSEQIRIAALGWPILLAYVIATSALYGYLDVYSMYDSGLYVLANLINWALGYLLLVSLMQRAGYFQAGKGSGVGTYFVLGILLVPAVLLGVVLLVIPGLYLLLRWLPAYADALVNGGSAMSALRRSWRSTKGSTLPLARAALAPIACFVISLGIVLMSELEPTGLRNAMVVSADIAVAIGIAWFTTLGIATFGVLGTDNPAADDGSLAASSH